MAERDYSAAHEATIRKWTREEERRQSRANASEENFKNTLVNSIRQEKVRRSVVREVKEVIDNPNRSEMFSAASDGTSRGYDDGEIITGWENGREE